MSRKKRSKSNVWCARKFFKTMENINFEEWKCNVAWMNAYMRKGIIRYIHLNPRSDITFNIRHLMICHKIKIVTFKS